MVRPPGFRFSGDCDEATAVGGVVDPTTNNNIPEDAYAIKDTVSVLYWYEKLSRNGNF